MAGIDVAAHEPLALELLEPVGFLEEIRRGELVHVPLVEPGLAQSRIGILVPRYRRLSPPARLMINHISERLRAFGDFLAAPPRHAGRRSTKPGRRS